MGICYHNSKMSPVERLILENQLLLLQHLLYGEPEVYAQIEKINQQLAEQANS